VAVIFYLTKTEIVVLKLKL